MVRSCPCGRVVSVFGAEVFAMAFPVETVAVLLFLFECGCSLRHCGLLEAGSLELALLLLATGWFLDRAFSFLSLSMRVRMQPWGRK